MKNYKDILAEITVNENRAKAAEEAAERITDVIYNPPELQNATTPAERHRILKSINPDPEAKTKAAELYTEAENLRSINKILQENARASFAAYITPIITEIMQKYNGKQYGEKTREKIRKAANEHGFGFYFDGYRGKNTIEAYALTDAGYTNHALKDISIYATDADGHRAYYISEGNTIQDFQTIKHTSYYTYTDNPQDKRGEIENAYKEYVKAYEAAKAAQSALNALLPEGSKHFDAIGYLSPYQKF